jgi:hypothetical protein
VLIRSPISKSTLKTIDQHESREKIPVFYLKKAAHMNRAAADLPKLPLLTGGF